MIMKSSAIFVALASIGVLAGCDNILGLDNRDAPGSTLTGRVVFEGEGVGLRSNGVQLELWEPRYQDQQYAKIPIYLDQDGSFTARLFDGDYLLNLLPGNGPWVNSSDTTEITLRGQESVDVAVTPYFVIRDPEIIRNAPADPTQGGSITATFRVEAIAPANAQRRVELVGVYVSGTSFADRNVNPFRIGTVPPGQVANNVLERARSAIQTELDTNGTISITVPLPNSVYSTQSPVRREFVFARVGVKTAGVQELLYSPVVEIAL